MMADIHQLVCNTCGYPHVITDAYVSMNPETGEMELEHDFKTGWCNACLEDIQYRHTHTKPGVLQRVQRL